MGKLLWSFLVAFMTTLRRRLREGPLRPSWPFGFEVVVRYLRRDWEETSAWPPARLRSALDARPYPQTFVKRVPVRDGTLGGVAARWFTPPAKGEGAILFFHGGSYVYGSARTTHAEICARLALESGVEVVGIDYRLAPEHPYPAALEDARAVLAGLVASGIAPDRIVVAGDSAGGNLAIELMLWLRDNGKVQPRAAILLSPWSDLEMKGASFVENDAFDFGTRDVLVAQAAMFAGALPLTDPRISPLHAELKGLAPTLVLVGECEIPRDDILALAARLESAGVDTEVHRAPDMPHNAPMFASYHPEGKRALDAMASFAKRMLA